ncbi:anti-sigma factor family protein [Streptomyces halobius]|uniref:Zf-HC2 domain-containing protein n=1 Tax=Streptomyces halobius TaxID=2879846 RepID=A0ABY4MH54_9ACTN|nr:zf-HC2 domain-containing protein [Streptomyces halobius]UQA97058.1 zf-HC2 domain-containing protein [Streptomyces halobius]
MSAWLRRRDPAQRRMNCMQVARVLQAYLDGESDEVTARRVAAHLEDCRRCGLQARTYREIKEALARRERPDEDAVARLRGFGESLLRGGAPEGGEGRAPGA